MLSVSKLRLVKLYHTTYDLFGFQYKSPWGKFDLDFDNMA